MTTVPAPDAPTRAQLQAEACIVCGSQQRPLLPAGFINERIADGVIREWPVVACTAHLAVDR